MPGDVAETPTVVTVSDGLYVRQAVDNIAWIDLGGFAVVVDALEQPELEQEVFQAIRSTVGGVPVRFVLNTHGHYDHTALNDAFRREFGAQIVSQRAGGIPPEGRWFQGPRRKVHMFPLPGCHTDEDCCAWVEPDKALFVGDIFGWGLIPLSTDLNDKTAGLLRDTYARLIGLDAAVVIPGHGPVCTTAELRRWVEYFNWLIERVEQACRAGGSDAQIMERVRPPDDMKTWWRFLQWKHQDSLSKVLGAVRRGRLKGRQ
jgi:glyoxylase-like metal-dependent hydrolase (beta-lactamase superfamily II)